MRRTIGGALVVLGAGLLLPGGTAGAAAGGEASGPVSQEVAVAGSAPEDGLLVHASRSRNESCSLTRNVRNRTGGPVGFRVLDDAGVTLTERSVAAGAQVTVVVDAELVTVPLFLVVAGDEPVELAQVGPFAPCGPAAVPPEGPPAPSTTVPGPAVATPSAPPPGVPDVPVPAAGAPAPPPEAPGAPAVGPPTTTSSPTGATTSSPTGATTPVSVLGARVTEPSGAQLPRTGAGVGTTGASGLAAIAVGAALLVAGRAAATRASSRRG